MPVDRSQRAVFLRLHLPTQAFPRQRVQDALGPDSMLERLADTQLPSPHPGLLDLRGFSAPVRTFLRSALRHGSVGSVPPQHSRELLRLGEFLQAPALMRAAQATWLQGLTPRRLPAALAWAQEPGVPAGVLPAAVRWWMTHFETVPAFDTWPEALRTAAQQAHLAAALRAVLPLSAAATAAVPPACVAFAAHGVNANTPAQQVVLLARAAVRQGQVGVLNGLLHAAPAQLLPWIGNALHASLHLAAVRGQAAVIAWLLFHCPQTPDSLVRAHNYQALCAAMMQGHASAAQALLHNVTPLLRRELWEVPGPLLAIMSAVRAGHVQTVQDAMVGVVLPRATVWRAVTVALEAKQAPMLRALLARLPAPDSLHLFNWVQAALESDAPALLTALWEGLPAACRPALRKLLLEGLTACVLHGRPAALQFLLTTFNLDSTGAPPAPVQAIPAPARLPLHTLAQWRAAQQLFQTYPAIAAHFPEAVRTLAQAPCALLTAMQDDAPSLAVPDDGVQVMAALRHAVQIQRPDAALRVLQQLGPRAQRHLVEHHQATLEVLVQLRAADAWPLVTHLFAERPIAAAHAVRLAWILWHDNDITAVAALQACTQGKLQALLLQPRHRMLMTPQACVHFLAALPPALRTTYLRSAEGSVWALRLLERLVTFQNVAQVPQLLAVLPQELRDSIGWGDLLNSAVRGGNVQLARHVFANVPASQAADLLRAGVALWRGAGSSEQADMVPLLLQWHAKHGVPQDDEAMFEGWIVAGLRTPHPPTLEAIWAHATRAQRAAWAARLGAPPELSQSRQVLGAALMLRQARSVSGAAVHPWAKEIRRQATRLQIDLNLNLLAV